MNYPILVPPSRRQDRGDLKTPKAIDHKSPLTSVLAQRRRLRRVLPGGERKGRAEERGTPTKSPLPLGERVRVRGAPPLSCCARRACPHADKCGSSAQAGTQTGVRGAREGARKTVFPVDLAGGKGEGGSQLPRMPLRT